MRRFRTLRGRLVAGVLLVNAALLVAMGAGLWITVRTMQSQAAGQTLQLSAAQLVAATDITGGQVVVPADDSAAVTARGVFGWVLDARGQVRARLGGAPLTPPRPLPPAGQVEDTRWPDGTPMRLFRRPLSGDSGAPAGYSLLVGLSLAPLEQTSATILLLLAVAIPLGLVWAAAGAWWVAGRVVAPLGAIAAQAERISHANLAERVGLRDPPAEVGALALTFNAMLERLAAAFARERQFTADASHELRTPLGLLKAQISLALNRPRNAAALTAMLGAMDADVDRLTRLVDRMLLLARLETAPSATVPVDLEGLVGGLVEQWQPSAAGGGVALTWAGSGPAWVCGEPDHLVQLFLNLLDNAVAWTPAGGRVRVALSPVAVGWQVAIGDGGPGIAAEHLPHLFERFYRVDPARTRETGGTGLGLAIAQAIAAEHGGRITVESRLGAGSTFVVWLPRVAAPEVRLPDAAPTATGSR